MQTHLGLTDDGSAKKHGIAYKQKISNAFKVRKLLFKHVPCFVFYALHLVYKGIFTLVGMFEIEKEENNGVGGGGVVDPSL